MNRAVSPPGIAPPVANYVHAVISETPSRLLHTSGVVPVDVDGSVPDGIEEQAAIVWTNIQAKNVIEFPNDFNGLAASLHF